MNENLELDRQNSGFYYGWTVHFREEDNQWDVVDPDGYVRGVVPDPASARHFIDGWRAGEAAEQNNQEGVKLSDEQRAHFKGFYV